MMHQVLKAFPDDKPITAICIVEDPAKCPPGFNVVSRTHDQDSDADLWKESNFFIRKVTRYLCLSKTEGIADYVVEFVGVINEKEAPPDGCCLIPRTIDSEQRAWRKRQMCYRLTRRNLALSAITDIILLGRAKKAPEGFSLAGEINGIVICFKTGPIHGDPPNPAPLLGYSLNPFKNGDVIPRPAPRIPTTFNDESPPHDYENLIRPTPKRPAPPPPPTNQSNYSTIASYHGLEGIPFVLNPRLVNTQSSMNLGIPTIKVRTQFDLDSDYDYDFRLERQT
ncbi:multivesicular body subunit 12B [Macrosteles quadrilineatus]|uniref:multivesicular body subunit 12B n=1 Tax=Macrosteles quadrilineatus TaxID=74068 RepID=UPI0023E21E89|nr:multivesicular body subunit 12B [Macrosteles quadrilineatus]